MPAKGLICVQSADHYEMIADEKPSYISIYMSGVCSFKIIALVARCRELLLVLQGRVLSMELHKTTITSTKIMKRYESFLTTNVNRFILPVFAFAQP